MLSRISSFGLRGVEGYPVMVELDLANGLPGFTTVGLPDAAVRESRDRVCAAVRNSGYQFPQRRITVNLAPAQSRKQGSHFDLPIALAVLAASGQLPAGDWMRSFCFVGELALDGGLRPVRGVLAMAAKAKSQGFSGIIAPRDNATEAAATGLTAYGAVTLREVADFLAGAPQASLSASSRAAAEEAAETDLDFSDVRGQPLAKRALEIAAAGGHHILLVGPPGAGKSMLARRLPTILPELTPEEALEVTRIHGVCQDRHKAGLISRRPFRAPHHGASHVALIGGGHLARPGEVSLAHGGVLFLDELAEFSRLALESLRQPLEDGKVVVARARETVEYPARFSLVAACNLCPCGWRGHPVRPCACTPLAMARYLSRLSGPLLDRIDMQIEVSPVAFEQWAASGQISPEETSRRILDRVRRARQVQVERLASSGLRVNAHIPPRDLRRHCALDAAGLGLLEEAARKLGLSARSLDRVLRVARTIADLDDSPGVSIRHLGEAMQYRSLERLRP
ncbi:MAG: YifB family Mg chelatase-like AAA ATPase [Elusimicrobia bacterium]|nr:YifB family Mg chelatase-like AAA ATPase [Elusimicrobiota bacterium]